MNKFYMPAVSIVAGLILAGCTDTATNTNTNTNLNANMATPAASATASREKSRSEYTEREAQEAREKAKGSGETVGDTLDDAWIHTKIVAKLIANTTTPERKINVDVAKNVVTLRGTVDTAEEKNAAEKIAKETDGVTKVVNQLKIAPAAKATPKTTGKAKPNY